MSEPRTEPTTPTGEEDLPDGPVKDEPKSAEADEDRNP